MSNLARAHPELVGPDGSGPISDEEIESKHAAIWHNAILIIDASELPMRDLIERELLTRGPVRQKLSALDRVLDGICEIRTKAFQDALPPLREEAVIFYGKTMEQWAGQLLRADLKRIKSAIRSGLTARLPSAEIARKVIGSVGLNGLDGQTEMTRHEIARLGAAVITGVR